MRPSAGLARDGKAGRATLLAFSPAAISMARRHVWPMIERNEQPRSQSSSRIACTQAKECPVAWRKGQS
jgi:hypothetical protein